MNKKLNTLDATMLVMGSMIGSGIFLVSSEVGRSINSGFWWLYTWLLTSFLTITGAYAYGKLSTIFPKTGGQYIYLKEAYSPMIGFLFGWSTFLVIQTGTIAAVAVAFAKYTSLLFPNWINESPLVGTLITSEQLLASSLIITLTWINLKGIQFASLIQNIFTFTKIAAIVILILIGFYFGFKLDWIHFSNFFKSPTVYNPLKNHFDTLSYVGFASIFGASLIGPLFSSSAWNNVTFASADFQDPHKTIAKGLVYGSALVCLLYILTNISYLGILPLEGNITGFNAYERGIMFASQDRLGSAALETVFGSIGAIIMAILIMISTFGCNNGIILAGGRLFEAMAKDQLFFSKASQLNQAGVPANSLVIQGIWATILCFSGSYSVLLDFTVFAILLFYFLTVLALFKKKITKNEIKWKQQILFIVYLVLLAFISINLLIVKPTSSLIGLFIVMLGIPFYFIMKAQNVKE